MSIFEKYIPLKDAAATSGYHPDYIGELVRAGRIQGKKIGRAWHVLEADVKKHLATKHFVPADTAIFTVTRPLRLATAVAVLVLVAALIASYSSDAFTDRAGVAVPQEKLSDIIQPDDPAPHL